LMDARTASSKPLDERRIDAPRVVL